MSKQTPPPPRNLEIGRPAQPAASVNWKGISMLFMAIGAVAGGALAYKWGLAELKGQIGLVIAVVAPIGLFLAQKAGWNPPTDYVREGLERDIACAESLDSRQAAERKLAAYDDSKATQARKA